MIIKKLTLVSYGKFKNKAFELKNGLNVFYGENGSGKSTVASALKTFLYKNMKGNRKYKRNYIPLDEQKGIFEVEFETGDGSRYETNVTLGQTAAKSLAVTVKKPLNGTVALGDAEPGEFFLETSEDMYDSVCFIREPSDFMKVAANEDIVSEELSGAVCSEKGNADILNAVETLNAEISILTRKTATGSIFPLKEELEEINLSIHKAEEIMSEEERLKNEIKRLESSLSEKRKERVRLEADKKLYREYSEYEEYLEYLRRKKELEELASDSCGGSEEFAEMSPEDEKRMLALELAGPGNKTAKSSFPLWVVLLGVSVALAITGIFIKPVFYFAAVFAAFGIVCAVKEAKKREEEVKTEADRLEYKRLCERYGVSCYDDYVSKRSAYLKKKAEGDSLKEKISAKEASLKELEGKVKIFESAPELPGRVCDFDRELRLLDEEITGTEKNSAVLKEREKNLFNNFPEYDLLIKRREELKEKISELEYELEICKSALDIMEITASSYKESYLPKLLSLTGEILADAGVVDAEKLIIDEKLNITVREKGSPYLKGDGYISSGISDSLYFALRLAVIRLAFEGKELPTVILDDPFIRLDDKNYEKWVCYLNEKCPFQTVFFTAKQRIFQITLEKDTINRL